MSWLSIAAGLLRDAMGSSSAPEPVQDAPPPESLTEMTDLLNRHRAEIDKNFEAIVGMLNAQKSRHLEAMKIQRRWNYGLTAALVAVAGFAVALYWFR
jgi:hypothetical protein